MTNHNRNISARTHGRKVNQRNKEIVNYIYDLPVGEYKIIVEEALNMPMRYEGSMVLDKDDKWIYIIRGRS